MVSHKNVIEMNGKLYDARTGRVLQGDIVRPATPKPAASIDGFVKALPTIIKPSTESHSATKPSKPLRNHSVGINHKRRNPQRSQILMRSAVRRPSAQGKKPALSTVNKVISSGERTMRAQSTAKSPYIHRYHASPTHGHITKTTAPLSVVEPPQQHSNKTAEKPELAKTHHHVALTHHKKPTTSEQLFNNALEHAKSPTKPARAKRSRSKAVKRSSLAGSVLAAFLLFGFIAYLNWPNLNMRLASSQAGFEAELPDYQPSGYSFAGPVSFEAGKVVINFRSNTDNRAYTLQQEVSSWNSQSLQDNFLTAQNKTFETQQEGGRTIYLYDQGKATWVNGGVWYQIDGQSLSPDQLIKIASSL